MGKGELHYYDLIYNFTEKLKIELQGNSEEYRNKAEKEYIDKLYNELKILIPKLATIASYQYEIGNNGNHHIQMRLKLRKPVCNSMKSDKGIKKLLSDTILNGCKILPTCNTVVENDDWNYTQKLDSRYGDTYYFRNNEWTITTINNEIIKEKHIEYIPRQFRNLNLKPWQLFIINNLNNFNDRIINFIYDPIGNKGKSTLASICDLLHECIDMPPMNDFDKLIATACNICTSRELRMPKAFFIDLPRAMEKNKLNGFLSACEQIKKGKLYDVRHNYKYWWIDSPQIWIFSNNMVDFDLLSSDRWKLWIFDDENNLIEKKIILDNTNPLDEL